jgi:putative inorganic carbon (HCO3(-)) transporter
METFKRKIPVISNEVNSFTFFLYSYFLVDYFLHLSQRFPIYANARPTLVLILLIALLLLTQLGKFKSRETSIEFKSLNMFLLYLVISLPLVEYAGSVVQFNLPPFVKALAFFYFTALIIDTPKRLKIFVFLFITLQVTRVLEPLYLNITDGYWGDVTYKGGGEFANRLSGAPADTINPNELGFVIVTMLPFLHYLLLPKGIFSKLIYSFLAVALLWVMILTMSRSAILALLIIGWMVFKDSKNKIILIAFSLTLAVIGWSQLGAFHKDRYISLIDSNAQGASTKDGRIKGMIEEFRLGFERPLLGHGVGTTPEVKYQKSHGRQASHNMYGELLIETGIIGFFLFLRFIFSIRKSLTSLKEKYNEDSGKEYHFYKQLNKAMVAVFLMYFVYSINYYGLSQYYWYLFGGLTVACYRLQEKVLSNKAEENNIAETAR